MKNLVLIGFMASGKTSIGEALSKQIDYTFIDLDVKLEELLNTPIRKIMYNFFYKDDPKYKSSSRKMEKQNLLKRVNILTQDLINSTYVLQRQLIVINYFTLLNDNITRMLKHNGYFLYLLTDLQHVLVNTMNDEKEKGIKRLFLDDYAESPHFLKCRKYSQAQRLLTDAKLVFEKNANYVIDVRDKSIEMIVHQLLKFLEKNYLIV